MQINQLEKDLKKTVGDRITTSLFERRLYASDIVYIPDIIKLIVKPVPVAVVKPSNVQEVSSVVRYCFQQGIPVVPRGAGSSGLFGAVPKREGVVLDLTDMTRVVNIDVEQQTATVEAGLTWWQLENKLGKHSLSLLSYPSSAISATLGGWVMTGGLGIGSLKYGPVSSHILSAEMVMPDGSIVEYDASRDLARLLASEGMLAIITRLTLKVRKAPEITLPHLSYFADINDLFKVTAALARREILPYSLELMDHGYLTFLQNAGYPVTEYAARSGVLIAVYDGAKVEMEKVRNTLVELIRQYNGEERGGADEEWRQRFNMLRVKRAVPDLILSSVYIPTADLPRFYSGLMNLNKRRMGLIGYAITSLECNLMPIFETDRRNNGEYIFALHNPREISNLAISFGGKPGGGIGVWNAPYKHRILSKERINEIKTLKSQHDPAGIMNPGMWLNPPLLFQSQVYQLAMGAAAVLDKLPTGPGKPESLDFQQELSNCVQCGYCMSSCPTRGTWISSTPRGRILAARELLQRDSRNSRNTKSESLSRIFQCTLCGRCRVDCSVNIRSREMWLGVRDHLIKHGVGVESLKAMVGMVNDIHNISGRPNEGRTSWLNRVKLPSDLKAKRKAEIVYFTGCVSSFFPVAQGVARAFVQILGSSGLDFTVVGGEEWCCGFPLMSAGESEAAEKCIVHNLELLGEMGAKTVVTTCPGCYRVWKEEYSNVTGKRRSLKVLHSTELIADLIRDRRIKFQSFTGDVTYHDPCDLGRNGGIMDEPRYIMQNIPGLNLIELEANRQYCSCCGAGGDLLASNQDLSMTIARRKIDEILKTGAQAVVTACPSCIRSIHMAKTAGKLKLEVMDITELCWKALGG